MPFTLPMAKNTYIENLKLVERERKKNFSMNEENSAFFHNFKLLKFFLQI